MSKTVYHYRKEIADHLRRNVAGDTIVVTTPDHPMVMRPIDILVGGRNGLTAMIIPTLSEMRNPMLLHSRVTLNTLAMPAGTVFVFLDRAEDVSSVSDLPFSESFALDDRRAKNAITKIANSPSNYRRYQTPPEVLRNVQTRFANTYRIAGYLHRRKDEAVQPARGRSSRRPMRDRLPSGLEGAFFEEVPTSGAITGLLTENTHHWFRHINGTLELFDEPASVAFMSGYPRITGDPDKILRASAFAGWVCSSQKRFHSNERIEEMIARFSRLQ